MNPSVAVVGRKYGIQIAVLILVTGILLIVFPSFANISSIFGSLNNFASVGFIALGLAVTMIAGELDMSVASMAVVSGIVAIQVATIMPPSGLGLFASILIPVIIGVGFGMFQGWAIYRLRINSLVFTIGTLILLRGLAYVISGSAPVNLTDYTISDILAQRWGFLSPSIVIALVVFIAIGLFLAVLRPGREIFAIGGARAEAVAAGVPLRRTMMITFAISGGCAALAGALVCLRNASGTPLAFSDLLVQGISATLIGGISLYGGRGSIWNVILGIAIVSVLSSGMSAGGAQPYVATLVTGILLFLLIIVEFVRTVVVGRSRFKRARVQAIA
jgi:ribose/xylose/arabinose/galactoside ABC-type transport system permease subunit